MRDVSGAPAGVLIDRAQSLVGRKIPSETPDRIRERLARAADEVRGGHTGRATIPRMEERQDEIGDLASSLSAMTRALYDRIERRTRTMLDRGWLDEVARLAQVGL